MAFILSGLIHILVVASLLSRTLAPTDIDRLNKFAIEYTLYAKSLDKGIVDVARWQKVKNAWEDLR